MNKTSSRVGSVASHFSHHATPISVMLGVLFICLSLYLLSLTNYSIISADSYYVGTITVNGHGEAEMKPDIRRVTITINPESTSTSTSSKKALTSNIENYKKVVAYLKNKGVGDMDIQKVSPTVFVARLHGNNVDTPKTIEMDLEKISSSISVKMSEAEVENPGAAKAKALELALNDAKMSAYKVSRSLNAELGKVTSYYENPDKNYDYSNGVYTDEASSKEEGSDSASVDISVSYQIR